VVSPKIFAFFSNRGLPAVLGAAWGLTAAGAGAGFLPFGGCGRRGRGRGGKRRGGRRGGGGRESEGGERGTFIGVQK